jgi:magnesium transporter
LSLFRISDFDIRIYHALMPHRHHRKHKEVRRRTQPGAAPGIVVADPQSKRPTLTAIAYDKAQFIERKDIPLEEVRELCGKHLVLWLNVDGLGDAALIEELGKMFGLHRLALEDVVNTHQRPKIDDYGETLFIVSRMAHDEDHIFTEQLSIFLGRGFVVTFQDCPGDSLEPVRERLRKSIGKIRELPADNLAYSLLDATIDGYYPVLEHISDRLEVVEEEVLERADEASMIPLRELKRDLLMLRRAIWPHREALGLLIREKHSLVSEGTQIYLRDCYDHVVQLIDLVEVYRELTMDLRDFYMSAVSNRINETMRVLTIVSTIFIPITFIAGVYGMNFDTKVSSYNMPELEWPYGYPFSLALMVLTTVFMIGYFRKQGWVKLRWLFPKRSKRAAREDQEDKPHASS